MTAPITSTFAKESSHWYAPDGTPAYTIIGANGNERATTLRDARKLGLLPSVTGIIRMAAAPQLEKWKRNQVLLSALTLPRMPDEPEAEWLKRVERDWQEQGRAAADRGTAIHAAVEKHYRGETPDLDLWEWVKAARDTITAATDPVEVWHAERSFATPIGYGGKVDLHNLGWVVDVKGKEGDPTESAPALFDEHLMQLAAYRVGLGVADARAGILFIGRDVPKARFVEASADDLRKGWGMFKALLDYWCAKNGYFPR